MTLVVRAIPRVAPRIRRCSEKRLCTLRACFALRNSGSSWASQYGIVVQIFVNFFCSLSLSLSVCH